MPTLAREREAVATSRRWQLIVMSVALCLPFVDLIALILLTTLPPQLMNWQPSLAELSERWPYRYLLFLALDRSYRGFLG
jgi:hypothetical protein